VIECDLYKNRAMQQVRERDHGVLQLARAIEKV
jgi:hypothetical protein